MGEQNLPNDNYGRSVTLQISADQDIYTVLDQNTQSGFSLEFAVGTPQANVYATINSMPVSTQATQATASITASPMNTAQRNSLIQIQGSIIFNTDTLTLQYFNGQTWIG